MAGAVRPRMHTIQGVAPAASPPAPPVRGRRVESEPPADGGWDEAEALSTSSIRDDDDTAVVASKREPVRAVPNVELTSPSMTQKLPDSPPTPVNRAPQTAAAAMAATPLAPPATPATPATRSTPGLASTEREEVWTIVRAAVDEAIAPLGARIKELEARLEAAEKNAAAKPQATATQRLASIPVSMSGPPPKMDIPASPAVPNVGRPGSIPPTGLGVGVTPAARPAIDLEAIAKQPVGDLDFPGGSKRLVGRVVVAAMLLAVLGAVVMTILSHS